MTKRRNKFNIGDTVYLVEPYALDVHSVEPKKFIPAGWPCEVLYLPDYKQDETVPDRLAPGADCYVVMPDGGKFEEDKLFLPEGFFQ